MQYTILPPSILPAGIDFIHLAGFVYVIAIAAVVWFVIGGSKANR